MNQTDMVNAATQAAQKSKNLIGQQVDKQAAALGSTLAQTAKDLGQVGSNLRESGTIGGAAQLADWAAGYVTRTADYLSSGHTDQFIHDLEGFGRDRPWAIAASAATVGFLAARIVKASSARRYQAKSYDSGYSAPTAASSYGRSSTGYGTSGGSSYGGATGSPSSASGIGSGATTSTGYGSTAAGAPYSATKSNVGQGATGASTSFDSTAMPNAGSVAADTV